MEISKDDIGKTIMVVIKQQVSSIFKKDMTVFCEILDDKFNFKLTTAIKNKTQTFSVGYLGFLTSLQKI